MGPFDLSRGGGERDMQPFVEGEQNGGGIVEAAVDLFCWGMLGYCISLLSKVVDARLSF